ncbi:MAG: hypothetical protein ACQESR_28790 [Planctomycetota bacterium]
MFSRWAFILGCCSLVLLTNNASVLRGGDFEENSKGLEARKELKASDANRSPEVLLDLTNPRVFNPGSLSNPGQPALKPVALKLKPKRTGPNGNAKQEGPGDTCGPTLDGSRPGARSESHQTVNASKPVPAANSQGEKIPGAWRHILDLRRQDGDLYRGTVFADLGSPAAEEEFLEALRAIAARDREKGMRTDLPPSVDEKPSRGRPIHGERPVSTDSGLAATLRLAARQLDTKAADLEDERRYAEADEYRSLAHRLRTQARILAPAISPARSASRAAAEDEEPGR